MFNGTSIWVIYVIIVIAAYLIFAYLLKWGVAFSLFLAFVIGILVVFLVPKQMTSAGDTASYTFLAGVSAFLVVASFVFVLVSNEKFVVFVHDDQAAAVCM